MSLFSRLFKSKSHVEERPSWNSPSYDTLVAAVGMLLIAAREKRDDSLRRSERMGELLGLLWLDDKRAHAAVWEAFNSIEKLDRDFVERLAQRVCNIEPRISAMPADRYEVVVAALHDEIVAVSSRISESPVTSAETKLLVNVVTLARILLPPELHSPICELLIDPNLGRRADAPDEPPLPSQNLLKENIYRFLSSIAVEEIPVFWDMLRNEEVSQELWPALRRIRDRKAVPYLLDLLPEAQDEEGHSVMSLDGQKEVIQVLREIGDLRAVPVLLAMEKRLLPPPEEKPGIQTTWDRALAKTWRERNELARVAGQAARHLLRNSPEANLQHPRPFYSPTSSGETLRPTQPKARPTSPGERMRASQNLKRTDQDE